MKPKSAFHGKRSEAHKKGKVQKTNWHPLAAKMRKGVQKFLNRPPQNISPYTVNAVIRGNKLCRKKLAQHSSDNSNSWSGERMKNNGSVGRSKAVRKTDYTSTGNNSNSWSDERRKNEDSDDQSDSLGSDEESSAGEEQDMELSDQLVNEDSDSADSDSYDNMFSLHGDSDVEDDALDEVIHRPLVLLAPTSQKASGLKRKKRDSYSDSGSIVKNSVVAENYSAAASLASINSSISEGEIFAKGKLSTFECSNTGSVVVVASHPSYFTLHGQLQVFAVSGSIDIYGYILNSERPSTYVYSSDRYSNLQVKTRSYDLKSARYMSGIRELLKCHVNERVVAKVADHCDGNESSIIVLLRKHQLAYATDFVSGYLPKLFHTSCRKKLIENDMKGFQICVDIKNAVTINQYHTAVGDRIDAAIQLYVDKRTHVCPRVMIYGERQFGKSTTLRYLINRVLSTHERVFLLDCDPGQTEFTVPGCLSLTEVTKPLLGPAFTHQKRPVKMAFFGDISLEDFKAHKLCIDKLVECYKNNFRREILFINTMGWIKGLGKLCLDYLREKLIPTIEVQIVEGVIPAANDPQQYPRDSTTIPTSKLCFQIPRVEVLDEGKKSTAVDRRDAALLAYFGRCQPYFSPIDSLNALKPYCIRLEDVAVHVIQPVNHKHLLQAINASVVALCHVDNDEILVAVKEPYQFKILTRDADFRECLGFGIVRAVDAVKRLIYLVTPEPYSVLKKVNTLVKGNIPLPRDVFLKQNVLNQPIPYVSRHMETRTFLSQRIKRQHYNFPNSAD